MREECARPCPWAVPYLCKMERDPRNSASHYSEAGKGTISPFWLAPRGMSRVDSAAYIGVSPSLFDMLVKDGRMPGPKRINSRTVWDRRMLDAAFEALPDEESVKINPWDDN